MKKTQRSIGLTPLDSLLVFVPTAVALRWLQADPLWVFITSCLAIVPLAGWMGKATEHLAARLGEGIGGLLNASFGNAAELIIAFFALRAGLHDVVKASITGSIIGNILLVLGLSMIAGGVRFPIQTFNRTAASMGASLLLLSAIGLVIPAIFHLFAAEAGAEVERGLSLEIAIVLFATYGLSLVFSLHTHRHLYVGAAGDEINAAEAGAHWGRGSAIAVLVISSALVAVMAEILVHSVEHAARTLGMTEVFVGVILVAIIGNAAEHSTAVIVAMKGKMDLAINIAVGSSLQIALFVAPVLLFVSYAFGAPMDLVFTPFEVIAIVLAVLVVSSIADDGECNWMEGAQLLAVYLILGIAFYFLPPRSPRAPSIETFRFAALAESRAAPGTLVHIGERTRDITRISILDFDDGALREQEAKASSECRAFKDSPSTSWINVDSVHDVELLREFGQDFGLHPLVLEDIVNTDQRPKLEDYGEYLYIVVKMLSYKGEALAVEQVSLVLGATFVLSFQEQGKPGDVFDPIRARIRSGAGKIRKRGADFLAYSLIDAVVDNYFVILERVGDLIEALEDDLLTNPSQVTVTAIHHLRREMIFLRRSVWPLREMLSALQRGESKLVQPGTPVYLRDVYDHTIQVIDTIENLRDVLQGMLEIYLSSVNQRMTEVMKVLTVISTIFIPLTFVVGVYGMNFEYFPELKWRWGYPALWGIMIGIVALMLAFFKRKKWL